MVRTRASMISNENNGKTLSSSVAQIRPKLYSTTNFQFLPQTGNLIFTFTCNTFKTDTNRTEFLGAVKNPLHRSAINEFHLGNH